MANPTKRRIFVVDEDARWRVFLSELLEAHGYAVSTERDIGTGLAQASRGCFDLIIVDDAAFGKDYMDALQELVRKQDGYKVLITSPANWRIARQAFRLGAFDHLPKILDEGGEVLYRVEQALAARRPI
jgi:two-component system OmpR family response regulator